MEDDSHLFFLLVLSYCQGFPKRCLKYYLALLLSVSHTGLSHKILFLKSVYKKIVKSFLWPSTNTWQTSRAHCRHGWSTGQSCSIWTWHLLKMCQSATTRWLYLIFEMKHICYCRTRPSKCHTPESHCLGTSELFLLKWFTLRIKKWKLWYKVWYWIYCEDDFENILQDLIHRINLSVASLSTVKSCESPDYMIFFLIYENYESQECVFTSLPCLPGSSR